MAAQWMRGTSRDTPSIQKFRLQIEDFENQVHRCAPERNLIAAIIHRAFCDALNKDEKTAAAAQCWFESQSSRSQSFFWCLDFLGLARTTQSEFLKMIEYWKARGTSPQRKVAERKPSGGPHE